jgi:pimeloyl-ACP methyl ester carboxylesterase
LTGSLEPLEQREQLARVPQRHLLGDTDRVVPRALLDEYQQALGPADCLQTVILAGASHVEGWQQVWTTWRGLPLHCAP